MKIEIKNIYAKIEETPILRGVDLAMKSGEVHALMGPNGSGKSTISNVIMGNPNYETTAGEIFVDGTDIVPLEPHERARLGLFLAFQYPVEIPGVTIGRFLRRAVEIHQNDAEFSTRNFIAQLRAEMDFMHIDRQFINRYLNEGFSGGEKKQMEVLQMLMIAPQFAILDETDSGLDIDALKIVSQGFNRLREKKKDQFGALIITHYQRILDYIKPDFIHIMYNGKIVMSGTGELAHELESKGYDWIRERYGEPESTNS